MALPSRLYQIAKFYLFEPSSGLYGCPLAMTNGAAKTLEVGGKKTLAVHSQASCLILFRTAVMTSLVLVLKITLHKTFAAVFNSIQ